MAICGLITRVRVLDTYTSIPLHPVSTTIFVQQSQENITVSPRQVIEVGNVGCTPGQATYTLYNPGANQVEFKTGYYGNNKGFNSQSQGKKAKSSV
ncbi:hypothetical protein [Nostoc sp. LEGE 06077]|uniref:hypothetical protein n=1 Tax=Nostoc sp. LEGE 06077 TaxID=915325 RepID=UPI002AD4C42B|nr:hypothetical protein [Nostoc sp. LEGE 06077]